MRVGTIATRELASFFRLPVGWVSISLYLLLTGVVFGVLTLIPGQPATLRYFFGISGWLLLPVAPAVSMRLLSEEFRAGTIEPLMTSPVSDAAVVVGKYAGACLFMAAMLAPTAVYAIVLFRVSDPAPDLGPILAGYASLMLLGAFYLAVGTLFSSLTSNQTLAFLGTLLFLLAVLMLPDLLLRSPSLAAWAPAIKGASVNARIGDFAKGVLDTSHVVFFATVSAWFLTLATVVVQSRRWR